MVVVQATGVRGAVSERESEGEIGKSETGNGKRAELIQKDLTSTLELARRACRG